MSEAHEPKSDGSNETLDDLLDTLYDAKERARDIGRQHESAKKVAKELEAEVMGKLDDIGIKSAGSNRTAVSISEDTHPQIDDFDAFWAYVRDNDAPYLIQRRVHSASYKELAMQGEEIPGLAAFTKRTLSVRKKD